MRASLQLQSRWNPVGDGIPTTIVFDARPHVDATGVRRRSVPFTPEKVLAALKWSEGVAQIDT